MDAFLGICSAVPSWGSTTWTNLCSMSDLWFVYHSIHILGEYT